MVKVGEYVEEKKWPTYRNRLFDLAGRNSTSPSPARVRSMLTSTPIDSTIHPPSIHSSPSPPTIDSTLLPPTPLVHRHPSSNHDSNIGDGFLPHHNLPNHDPTSPYYRPLASSALLLCHGDDCMCNYLLPFDAAADSCLFIRHIPLSIPVIATE
jgi:hypothetical protein